MSSFSPLSFSTNSFSIASFSITVTEESATVGTPILNINATTSVPVNYVMDDMSNFKLFRGKGYTDGYGRFTVMGDPVQPQDNLRSVGNDRQDGPSSPEPDDSFVTSDVDPSTDL